ncbi:hypothetical protein [Clostridium saccharobutylicum]|uniref:Uncharacterized protein n=1 Tax=Clostridium saccharobutylicum TaxID=169679 RepID=A0A1S8N6D7_CLOSA|nr:hypothetical protein [Clostridium saccharobutylicum]OOM11841.1 hypothetical protein CLOSAC_22680 [Clostridium saccharobutylicum]
MFFITVVGSLILGTAIFGGINKKIKFISLNRKKAVIMWGICFLVSMIITSIIISLIHGAISFILLGIKIAPIILVIYGIYYIRKKLNNTGTNIE